MTIDLEHIGLVTYILYMYAIFEQKSAGAILKSFYINLKDVKKTIHTTSGPHRRDCVYPSISLLPRTTEHTYFRQVQYKDLNGRIFCNN